MTPLPARAPRPGPSARPAPTAPHSDAPARPTADGGYARADLAPGPDAEARARHITRDALARWDLARHADHAEAIAAYLTATAAAAACPPPPGRPAIILAIDHQPPCLRITLWDNGPPQPPPVQTGRHAPHDAGWWPTPRSGGKVTWAAIRAPRTQKDAR